MILAITTRYGTVQIQIQWKMDGKRLIGKMFLLDFKYGKGSFRRKNFEYHHKIIQMHSDKWRLAQVNSNYDVSLILLLLFPHLIVCTFEPLQVCPSYPKSVIVPSGVTDDKIRASASFRQNSRFPVMSYFHKKTKVNYVSYILSVSFATNPSDIFSPCCLEVVSLLWVRIIVDVAKMNNS